MAKKFKIDAKLESDENFSKVLNEKVFNLQNDDKIEDKTKKQIEESVKTPSKENLTKTIDIIKQDTKLPEKTKKELLKLLEKQFIEIFNFDNCPEDYNELKEEVKFLSKLAKSTFIIMAHRLKKIRDEELYKKDGYTNFKEFIQNEIKLKISTIYDYIDIVTYFDFGAPRIEKNIEYSKLRDVIPLLKAKNSDIPKEEIKAKFLNSIEKKSFREIREEAKVLKLKYGLIKDKIQIDELISFVDNAIKKLENLPLPSTEEQKEKLKSLIKFIEEIIK